MKRIWGEVWPLLGAAVMLAGPVWLLFYTGSGGGH